MISEEINRIIAEMSALRAGKVEQMLETAFHRYASQGWIQCVVQWGEYGPVEKVVVTYPRNWAERIRHRIWLWKMRRAIRRAKRTLRELEKERST